MADEVTRKMWNDAMEAVTAAAREVGDANTGAERAANNARHAQVVADDMARKVGIALQDHRAKLSAFADLAKRVGAQGGTVEDKAERSRVSNMVADAIQGATGRGN